MNGHSLIGSRIKSKPIGKAAAFKGRIIGREGTGYAVESEADSKHWHRDHGDFEFIAERKVPTAHDVLELLSRYRFPISNEKKLQAEIETKFEDADFQFKREHRLSDKDVIDFTLSSIGLEAKVKGGKREIFRQVERYAQHDCLTEIILVTNVPSGFPETINGKPIFIHNLAKAWM